MESPETQPFVPENQEKQPVSVVLGLPKYNSLQGYLAKLLTQKYPDEYPDVFTVINQGWDDFRIVLNSDEYCSKIVDTFGPQPTFSPDGAETLLGEVAERVRESEHETRQAQGAQNPRMFQ